MKKIISVILSIVLVLSLTACLSACGEQKVAALFTGKEANFIIVRAKEADDDAMDSAKYFRQALIDVHGIKAKYVTDEEEISKDKIEINIGVTNRPESERLNKRVKGLYTNNAIDYVIQFKDNVIYIVGATGVALQNGVKYFLSRFCHSVDLTIPENYYRYYHFGNEDGGFNIAGDTDLSEYKIIYPKYNMSYIIGMEIDNLTETLMNATGSTVERITDDNKPTKKEIIVGKTKRGNAPYPSNTDEFVIKMQGGKLYINGGNDLCTAMAVKELARLAKEGKPIDKDFEYVGSYSYALKNYEDNFKLTWSDEFDTLDQNVWQVSNGHIMNDEEKADGIPRHFSNRPSNVNIEDGNLVLRATYENNIYYGAELRTARSLWYKYGLIEISAKISNTQGFCSAFWTLGYFGENDFIGESDIFESLGRSNLLHAATLSHASDAVAEGSNVDYASLNGSWTYDMVHYRLPDGDSFADEYHTIGLYWDEDEITWVYDSRPFLTIDTTTNDRSKMSFSGMQQIILTQYSANNVYKTTGLPDANTDWSNQSFTIDKMELYQTDKMILDLK